MNFHHPYPGPSIGPIGLPDGVEPKDWRAHIEAEIERLMDRQFALVDLLDKIDIGNDPDFEPWLAGGDGDDREGGDIDTCEGDDLEGFDGEGDGCCDDEPSLGAPEISPEYLLPGGQYGWHRVNGSQEHWAQGDRKDLEENVEDEGEAVNEDGGDILDEPHDGGIDDEYSLGWSEHVDQRVGGLQRPWSQFEADTDWVPV
jgi:hypothetical protein